MSLINLNFPQTVDSGHKYDTFGPYFMRVFVGLDPINEESSNEHIFERFQNNLPSSDYSKSTGEKLNAIKQIDLNRQLEPIKRNLQIQTEEQIFEESYQVKKLVDLEDEINNPSETKDLIIMIAKRGFLTFLNWRNELNSRCNPVELSDANKAKKSQVRCFTSHTPIAEIQFVELFDKYAEGKTTLKKVVESANKALLTQDVDYKNIQAKLKQAVFLKVAPLATSNIFVAFFEFIRGTFSTLKQASEINDALLLKINENKEASIRG